MTQREFHARDLYDTIQIRKKPFSQNIMVIFALFSCPRKNDFFFVPWNASMRRRDCNPPIRIWQNTKYNKNPSISTWKVCKRSKRAIKKLCSALRTSHKRYIYLHLQMRVSTKSDYSGPVISLPHRPRCILI
mmetsp:Transcript_18844/g.43690  ORF Transcript_18844/g.43690 Transcript_18844/m.43690 type:complete len:132 (+) Transcript_18844:3-398(+)